MDCYQDWPAIRSALPSDQEFEKFSTAHICTSLRFWTDI